MRPYILRAYFNSRLQIAEHERKITASYRKFFFGHKGDMEARYSTHKGRLPEDMIESMRDAYRQSQPYLETMKQLETKEDIIMSIKKELLLAEGVNDDTVSSLDLSKSIKELREEIQEKQSDNSQSQVTQYQQKVVPLNGIEKYIVEGYEYVTTLPGERGIVRLPL